MLQLHKRGSFFFVRDAPAMKTTHFVAGAAILAVVVLTVVLWRQSDLSSELALLRAQVAAVPHTSDTSRPAFPASAWDSQSNHPDSPKSSTDLLEAAARIGELERVVNAQADLIEDLISRLGGVETNNQKSTAAAWSAMQAVGAPDSPAGDQRTAWAPATEDGGEEWLIAEFANPADAATVIVRENCAPGAIVRINAVTDAGSELPLWQGEAPKLGAVSDTPFQIAAGYPVKRVKIYLNTKKVPGWNEIDAVQLVSRDGTRQWATSARASSSYGNGAAASFQIIEQNAAIRPREAVSTERVELHLKSISSSSADALVR